MLARRPIRLLRLAIIASVYNVYTVSGGSAKPHVICAPCNDEFHELHRLRRPDVG